MSRLSRNLNYVIYQRLIGCSKTPRNVPVCPATKSVAGQMPGQALFENYSICPAIQTRSPTALTFFPFVRSKAPRLKLRLRVSSVVFGCMALASA